MRTVLKICLAAAVIRGLGPKVTRGHNVRGLKARGHQGRCSIKVTRRMTAKTACKVLIKLEMGPEFVTLKFVLYR